LKRSAAEKKLNIRRQQVVLEVCSVGKTNLVIAEFSTIPVGNGETSVGRYVAAAVQAFKSIEGLEYEVTAMGTVLAAKDLDTILAAVKQAHEAVVAMGAKRVESTLRIDDRRDKPRAVGDKVKAVKEYLKQA
jgi:uncharacterized protein (TIGR00106 family)